VVEEGEGDIGEVSPRKNEKVKSRVYEKIAKNIGGEDDEEEDGNQRRLTRNDSIHTKNERAREGIKYAVTELPKQSDYDHDDGGVGGAMGLEEEDPMEPVKSSIEKSVLNLPSFPPSPVASPMTSPVKKKEEEEEEENYSEDEIEEEEQKEKSPEKKVVASGAPGTPNTPGVDSMASFNLGSDFDDDEELLP